MSDHPPVNTPLGERYFTARVAEMLGVDRSVVSVEALLKFVKDGVERSVECVDLRARLVELEKQRDKATMLADLYQKDWYDSKSEFGTATGRLRGELREVQERARRAGQLLIEEIGAHKPENVDETAERAGAVIRELHETIERIELDNRELAAKLLDAKGYVWHEQGKTEK